MFELQDLTKLDDYYWLCPESSVTFDEIRKYNKRYDLRRDDNTLIDPSDITFYYGLNTVVTTFGDLVLTTVPGLAFRF